MIAQWGKWYDTAIREIMSEEQGYVPDLVSTLWRPTTIMLKILKCADKIYAVTIIQTRPFVD